MTTPPTDPQDAPSAVAVYTGHPAFAPREQFEIMMREKRELAEMARSFRNTLWGKDLEETTAKAVARWCNKHGIDATEVCVLGGQPYIEAAYYLRRLTELAPGVIEYARPDHVHLDPVLVEGMSEPIPEGADPETVALIEKFRRDCRIEHYRRIAVRSAYNLPHDVPAAVVFRVKRFDMAEEFTGADWCGGKGFKEMRRKDGSTYKKEVDPVGDSEPRKTAETRAARRALRYLINTFSDLKNAVEAAEQDAAKTLLPAIERDLAEAAKPPVRRGISSVAGADDFTGAGDREATTQAPPPGPSIKAQMYRLEVLLREDIWSDDERVAARAALAAATWEQAEEQLNAAKHEAARRAEASRRPATDKQKAFLARLMQSHHWNEEERADAVEFAINATASDMQQKLDFVQDELRDRTLVEQQSKHRDEAVGA